MRVLQFAFDGNSANPHLPENYTANTVVYTGTHDNTTTRAWFEGLPDNVRRNARSYAAKSRAGASTEVAWEFINLAWASKAGLAIAPLQDLLNLGVEGRMNVPGTTVGNWRWRFTENMIDPSVFQRLQQLTSASGRRAGLAKSVNNKRELINITKN